ncbi:NERD domain-containing protein [Oscillospiraceae bacterium MB08-C2-2]|nr:NERD domain-containing protein [Oscillospiraceae bacterium MB08-C2-2]
MAMGMGSVYYWAITAVLMALVLFLLAIPYLSNNVWDTKGKNADKKTARVFSRFGRSRGGRVLREVTIRHDGKTASLGTVLLLPWGLVIADTLGCKGNYYGDAASEQWVLTSGDERTVLPNPLKTQREATMLLREYLAASKLYNIRVETLVVYTNKSKDTTVFVDGLGKQEQHTVLPIGKLARYLEKDRFEADNGVNIEALAALLAENQGR